MKFVKVWNRLLEREELVGNPYAEEGVIPLGTVRPYYSYPKDEDGHYIPPREEIIVQKFDNIKISPNQRKAFNILLLGGSGDMKTLLVKLIWTVLADAGYYCLYIDPKTSESGRARRMWNNPRIPPDMQPKGMKLKHYLPVFATKDYDHMVHNFKVYSLRLKNIDEKYMWMGLGATSNGASKLAKMVKENPKMDLPQLYARLPTLAKEEGINTSALNSIFTRVKDIEDLQLVDTSFQEINMIKDFRDGYSVCISYNAREQIMMSYDVGEKIRRCARYYSTHQNRNPIQIFLDDSSFYAKKLDGVPINFAVQEIVNIGYNYRALGVSNVMAVQSLGIIDRNIADTYRIKIISPFFQEYEKLKEIGVPLEAVAYLKNQELMQDKDNHLLQYLLVDENNHVIPFFPFLPTVNHFQEVYNSKEEELIHQEVEESG